jgi:hypothetical protein
VRGNPPGSTGRERDQRAHCRQVQDIHRPHVLSAENRVDDERRESRSLKLTTSTDAPARALSRPGVPAVPIAASCPRRQRADAAVRPNCFCRCFLRGEHRAWLSRPFHRNGARLQEACEDAAAIRQRGADHDRRRRACLAALMIEHGAGVTPIMIGQVDTGVSVNAKAGSRGCPPLNPWTGSMLDQRHLRVAFPSLSSRNRNGITWPAAPRVRGAGLPEHSLRARLGSDRTSRYAGFRAVA